MRYQGYLRVYPYHLVHRGTYSYRKIKPEFYFGFDTLEIDGKPTQMANPEKALIEAGFSEEEVKELVLFKPVGCEKCKAGYKGRTGIYEVVKVTEAISRIVMEEGNSIEIAEACKKEGFNDLRASALKKARDGLISLEEVYRVTTGH